MTKPYSPTSGKNNPKRYYSGPLADVSDLISIGYLAKRAKLDRRNLRKALVTGQKHLSKEQERKIRPVLSELVTKLQDLLICISIYE